MKHLRFQPESFPPARSLLSDSTHKPLLATLTPFGSNQERLPQEQGCFVRREAECMSLENHPAAGVPIPPGPQNF